MHPRRLRVIVAGVLVATSLATPVSADPAHSYVREWNAHALNAIFNAGTNPPPPTPPGNPPGASQPPYVGALHMAMVQGAVYDAVNAIAGGFQPYRQVPAAPSTASKDAAAVTAAHDVLVDPSLRLPAATLQWIEVERAQSTSEISAASDADDVDAGVAAGAAAADAMLAARANDGRFPAVPFLHPEGTGAGQWRRTGPSPDQFAWVANVRPFMLNGPSQLRTDGPPVLTSAKYTAEYNEVKDLGSASSTSRTQAQTNLANFYTPNPVEMFNRNFRTVTEAQGRSTADEARLFAMLNLASADAAISCWNDKAFWHFWRPMTAIHDGDNDSNPDTEGDTGWTPQIATGNPPYPEHPSGYNCITGAMMYTAGDFFGTNKFTFRVTRTAAAGSAFRDYTRFTDVVKDTIDARIYQGIHFRSADVQGANIGKHAAHWLDSHFLQPVD